MTPETTGFAAELLAVASAAAELGILSLAAYVLLRLKALTAAEAAAAALLLPMVFLSVVFQSAFLVGLPAASVPVEILAVGLALAAIGRYRSILKPMAAEIRSGIASHPLVAAGAGVALSYLLVQALLVPPDSGYWIDLGPMAYLEQWGRFFGQRAPVAGRTIDPLAGSLNQSILFHLSLRAGTDRGLGLLGFAAFLSIGFSTYALARRYAWPPAALTTALVAGSMPRLVVQASGPGIELMAAAAALLVLVSLYRLLEQPDSGDLALWGLFLLFSISGREMNFAFPLVLGVLSVLLLYRRHGGRIWRRLLARHRLRAAALAIPAILLSRVWIAAVRLAGGVSAAAAADGYTPNTAGLTGALANLIRYAMESIHLPLPLAHLSRWMFGFSPMKLLEGTYRWAVTPFLGQAGAAAPFAVRWLPDESLCWFGPFGFLLVLPAVLYALWRGPRRIKSVALALVVYGYLVALVPAWQPGNARFFTPLFACAGFCVSFFLPPWRLTQSGRYLLQASCIGLLLYTAAMNTSKPLVGYGSWLAAMYAGDNVVSCHPVIERAEHSIWKEVAGHRLQTAENHYLFGDDRVRRLSGLIGPGKSVGVVAARPERAYPLLMQWPGRRVVPLAPPVSADALRASGIGYLLYLDSVPGPAPEGPTVKRIWSSGKKSALPGALFRIESAGAADTGSVSAPLAKLQES